MARRPRRVSFLACTQCIGLAGRLDEPVPGRLDARSTPRSRNRRRRGAVESASSRCHRIGVLAVPSPASAIIGVMPLTLVLGAANSAKAGEVLGAFAAASARGAILVVPTSADAAHYTRELAGQGAVLGSVLTFSGLAAEIAGRTGYAGRRLSSLQRERVLERALAGVELPSLGEAAATSGFPAAAGELIAELQRSLVTPQRFAAAMRTWAE
jgi:hypothetical protein